MTRHFSVLLFAFVACQTPAVFAGDGPAKDVPELQALSNYIGDWDVEITSKDSPFTKGEATAEWILGGRFVQQTGFLSSADGKTVLKITTLMTYDQKAKAYRMWHFLSDGATSEALGKWDAKKRTMTSVRSDGTTTTTTASFTKNGIERWTIVTTNQNNEVVGKIGGTNTRSKE
jgi:hypothetical protein